MENPYLLALTSPNHGYLRRIGCFAAAFAFLFFIVERMVKTADDGCFLAAVSSPKSRQKGRKALRDGLGAATTACSIFHAFCVSIGACWTTWTLAHGDPLGLAQPVWQWCLTFSQGYFLADALMYGTRREYWVLLHHLWMIIAHHPVGDPKTGCINMGLGDCGFAVWLSCTGYLAEISTILLGFRWVQIKVLRESSIWYTINSAVLLFFYPLTRIIAPAIIVFGYLWPKAPDYEKTGLSSLVTFTTVTYAVLALMSSYHLSSLLNGGLSRALFFSPQPLKEA